MDNEKELTQQETAPKPKKTTKKKTTKQETATEPEPQMKTEQIPSVQDATESTPSPIEVPHQGTTAGTPEFTASTNWNFYNQVQSVETKSSHGGSNKTPSVRRNAQKRIRKAKTQRASRRINRNRK